MTLLYPFCLHFVKKIEESNCPFSMALKLAIAGNIIDLGASGDVTEADVSQAIDFALTNPIKGDIESFHREILSSRNILYLTDNAGEIAFDLLFIEQLPRERVTVAVRGGPAINDATLSCAQRVGLTKLVKVIENGSDAPGTLLGQCSSEFMDYWNDSDLIIAKGQGNFESLSQEEGNIFFLFKAKCDVVSQSCGVPKGSSLLRANNG